MNIDEQSSMMAFMLIVIGIWMKEQTVKLIYFFFQAEDGIRDYKVTGVQTCALPIYGVVHWPTQ